MRHLAFVFLFLSLGAHAWESAVKFSPGLEMSLDVSCEPEETFCRNLCGNSLRCEVPAGICKNCIGASTFVSHFYREIGRLFQSTGRSIPEAAAAELLSVPGRFVFLQAQSPFNIYTGVGDLSVERHFESLCQDQFFSRPVVLARLDRRSRIEAVTHVICHGDFGGEVYEMSHAGQ